MKWRSRPHRGRLLDGQVLDHAAHLAVDVEGQLHPQPLLACPLVPAGLVIAGAGQVGAGPVLQADEVEAFVLGSQVDDADRLLRGFELHGAPFLGGAPGLGTCAPHRGRLDYPAALAPGQGWMAGVPLQGGRGRAVACRTSPGPAMTPRA